MSTGSQESDKTERARTVLLPRRSSRKQDEGNFRAGADSGVCELRPGHGGRRSFQNTQGALGCRSQLCFQAQLSGLPSWFPRAVKPQLPFLFLVGSLAARSDPSHPGKVPGHLVLALRVEEAFPCVRLPSGLSHHQDAGTFGGPGWSPPGSVAEMPLSAWVNLRATYFIHGLFCTRLLTASVEHLKALKRERLQPSP